ncbi:MAG: hypothetical protein CFE43_18940 [Burkholderiales bacterium PBB3]|nr:MAG: hypothetical protein CFE43_18940 [Burkholderiales bacterium PBB3]
MTLLQIAGQFFRRWVGASLLAGPVALCCLLHSGVALAADNLVVSFMISSGNQRTAWEIEVIKKFRDANPDITVTQIVRAQELYKSGFTSMLQTEAVDVAFWFAGERLNQVVDQNLLRPMDDPVLKVAMARNFVDSTLAATSLRGNAYGLPLSYYGWGFYYRKSLFASLGLRPPTQWAEFLELGRKLKAAGIAPTAVGAAEGWPAAAWFDYLNLRLNGIEFHRKLLSGDAKFTEPKVREVLLQWKRLQELGFFMPETLDKSWDAPLPFFYRNLVGVVLMGGFASAKFPPQLAQDIGFFPFPAMAAQVPQFEDAPLDILVLPRNGKNPEAAKRFLLFLSQSAVLNTYNNKVNQLSPLRSFQASDNNAGEVQALQSAKAIAFYFDRDAKPYLVEPAFAAFKQFMAAPFDVDKAIGALDKGSIHPAR